MLVLLNGAPIIQGQRNPKNNLWKINLDDRFPNPQHEAAAAIGSPTATELVSFTHTTSLASLGSARVPQAEISLNLLRGARLNPKLSAWAQVNGHFDFPCQTSEGAQHAQTSSSLHGPCHDLRKLHRPHRETPPPSEREKGKATRSEALWATQPPKAPNPTHHLDQQECQSLLLHPISPCSLSRRPGPILPYGGDAWHSNQVRSPSIRNSAPAWKATRLYWDEVNGKEIGRLFQGLGHTSSMPEGTNTLFFIHKAQPPEHKKPTYIRIICADRPKKTKSVLSAGLWVAT
jgi:hypothetical protein